MRRSEPICEWGSLDVVDETVVLSGQGLFLALDPEVLVNGEVFQLGSAGVTFEQISRSFGHKAIEF
jgi:hypothetical protein